MRYPDFKFEVTITRDIGVWNDTRRQIELEDPKCKAWIWIVTIEDENHPDKHRQFTPAPQGTMFESPEEAILDIQNFIPSLAKYLPNLVKQSKVDK